MFFFVCELGRCVVEVNAAWLGCVLDFTVGLIAIVSRFYAPDRKKGNEDEGANQAQFAPQ